jgi:hypothetical protein
MTWTQRLRAVSVLAVAFSLGIAITNRASLQDRIPPFGRYPRDRVASTNPGRQLVLFYFGKSTCVWSASPELPVALARIRVDLEKAARQRGASLVVVGVSVDRRVGDGLRHLATLGTFDEISAGSGWLNSLALAKVWDGVGAPAATPQLLLLDRDISVDSAPFEARFYTTRDENPVLRKIGLRDIQNWAAQGAPVPQPKATSITQR